MPTASSMHAGKRLFLGRVFPWAVLLVVVMPKVVGSRRRLNPHVERREPV